MQKRSSLPLITISLVVGFVITIMLATLAWNSILHQEDEIFSTMASAIAEDITRKITVATETMHGLSTLFHASSHVDADEFRIYSEEAMERHPYINSLLYMPKIIDSKRDSFVEDMLDDGYFTFSVNKYIDNQYIAADIKSYYFPVIYIEPFTPVTTKNMGYDFSSSALYQSAINKAIDTADAVTVYADNNNLPFKFSLVKAIYAGKVVPDDVDSRRHNANGILVINIDVEKMFIDLEGYQDFRILLNLDSEDEETVIYEYVGETAYTDNESSLISHISSYRIKTLGSEMSLDVHHRLHTTDVSYNLLIMALVTGFVMTALLYMVARNTKKRAQDLLLRNQEIERVVEQRTHELAREKDLLKYEITQREQAEMESSRLGKLVDESLNEIYVFDSESLHFTQVNRGARNNLGYTVGELLHMTPLNIKPEFTIDSFNQLIEPLLNGREKLVIFEAVHRRKDGTTYPVEVKLQLPKIAGKGSFIAMVTDLTDIKKSKEEMQKLSSAIQASGDAVFITNYDGDIEYVNPAFEELTGYKKSEVLGKTPRILKSMRHNNAFYQNMWNTILNGDPFRELFINNRKDGSIYYEEKTITPIRNNTGEITHFVSTGKDVSERMKAQEHLQYLANHDTLTGLANRRMFVERLEHSLQQLSRIKTYRKVQRFLAVLFLDLDRFKTINDSLGHDSGDQLLMKTSERLLKCVRDGDTVGRLGGDEFVILLEDMSNSDDADHVANKILDVLKEPFEISGQKLFINTSIGIAVNSGDDTNAVTLMKHADAAMYLAKDKGGATYEAHTQEISDKANNELMLVTKLRYALEREEFLLHYQPIIGDNGTRIVGAEALIRWHNSESGIIPPNEFIPCLEDTGLIIPVGEWILRTALNQLNSWEASGYDDVRISINISGRQIIDDDFIDTITALVNETQANTKNVVLEITESTLMRKHSEIIKRMEILNEMGITFAIDDFGTGYSSLSYIKRFPIQTLKIDRSFIRDMTEDSDDSSIVNAIISMAHQLKLNVVAEGVETDEQKSILNQKYCDYMQGFLFSKPLPEDQFSDLLKEYRKNTIIKINP